MNCKNQPTDFFLSSNPSAYMDNFWDDHLKHYRSNFHPYPFNPNSLGYRFFSLIKEVRFVYSKELNQVLKTVNLQTKCNCVLIYIPCVISWSTYTCMICKNSDKSYHQIYCNVSTLFTVIMYWDELFRFPEFCCKFQGTNKLTQHSYVLTIHHNYFSTKILPAWSMC